MMNQNQQEMLLPTNRKMLLSILETGECSNIVLQNIRWNQMHPVLKNFKDLLERTHTVCYNYCVSVCISFSEEMHSK